MSGEMTNEGMPNGWTEVGFDELNVFKSATINPADYPDEVFELYSVPTFPTRKPEILRGSEIGSTKQVVAPGDVLICKINPRINRVWKVMTKTDKRQIASSEWIVMRAAGADTEFLRSFFSSQSFREILCEDLTGVGGSLTRAQPKRVAKFRVPLAPLAEQKRIADKLEAVLGRVDACRTRLDRLPDLLKRFRQSVLAAATSGQLNEDWREVNKANAEWANIELGKLVKEIKNGLSQKPEEELPGEPILRISSVRPFQVYQNDIRYLRADVSVESYRLRKGDLLFTRYNGSLEFVGVCALVRHIAVGGLVYPDKLIRVRVDQEKVCAGWIEIATNSPAIRDVIENKARTSAGQTGISGKDLKELVLPVPPLAEQQEIIHRVEALFAFADRIEARLSSAQKTVERLTPAVLAKAFRGQLAPQDPNDEPASALLERLRDQPAPPRLRQRGTAPLAAPAPARAPAEAPKTSHRVEPMTAALPRPPQPLSPPKKAVEPPTPVGDLDRNELMALLREVLTTHGPCDRTTAIQQTAYALNYQRAGSAVATEIDNAIRAAVRRCVLLNEGSELRVNRASIAEMEEDDREFMKEQFLAAISQEGRVWVEREDAARLYAQWFGFRRTGSQIQDRVKSLINGLLRTQRLEASGTCIRRL